MLNLNDRSALENYYLLKKVPEFTHVTNPAKSVLKNSRYFSMRPSENVWNNESRCSEKQYQFYHQINEGYQDRIASLNSKEMRKQIEREQLNKLATNISRVQAQDRIQNRKLERTCLEYESKQPVSCATLIDFLGIKSQTGEMRKHKALKYLENRSFYLSGRAQSSWNDMSQTCEKFLLQATNERILEKDSQAFEDIVKRIEKDSDDELLRSRLVAANMAQIRQSFRKRSFSNCETEKHVLANRPSLHSQPHVVFVSGQGKDKGKTAEEEASEKLALQIKEFEETDKAEKLKINVYLENEKNMYNDEVFNLSPYAQAQQSPVSFNMIKSQPRSASNPRKYIKDQKEICNNSKQYNSNGFSLGSEFKNETNQEKSSDQGIKLSQILSQVPEHSPNRIASSENNSFLSKELKSKKNPFGCAPLDELEMKHHHKGHFQNEHGSNNHVESPVSLPLRFLKTPIKHRTNSRIDELSQPKLKSDYFTPTAQLSEREEFRGLLCCQVNKVDLNQSNPFVKTVLSNSKVARDLSSSNGLSRHTRNILSNSCYSSKNRSFFQQSSDIKQQNVANIQDNNKSILDNSQSTAVKQQQEVIHENSYFLTPIEEPCEDKDMAELSQFKINEKEKKRGFPGNTLREFRNAMKEIDQIKKKDAFQIAYVNSSQIIKQ